MSELEDFLDEIESKLLDDSPLKQLPPRPRHKPSSTPQNHLITPGDKRRYMPYEEQIMQTKNSKNDKYTPEQILHARKWIKRMFLFFGALVVIGVVFFIIVPLWLWVVADISSKAGVACGVTAVILIVTGIIGLVITNFAEDEIIK